MNLIFTNNHHQSRFLHYEKKFAISAPMDSKLISSNWFYFNDENQIKNSVNACVYFILKQLKNEQYVNSLQPKIVKIFLTEKQAYNLNDEPSELDATIHINYDLNSNRNNFKKYQMSFEELLRNIALVVNQIIGAY